MVEFVSQEENSHSSDKLSKHLEGQIGAKTMACWNLTLNGIVLYLNLKLMIELSMDLNISLGFFICSFPTVVTTLHGSFFAFHYSCLSVHWGEEAGLPLTSWKKSNSSDLQTAHFSSSCMAMISLILIPWNQIAWDGMPLPPLRCETVGRLLKSFTRTPVF